jgi:hypothetical protein
VAKPNLKERKENASSQISSKDPQILLSRTNFEILAKESTSL